MKKFIKGLLIVTSMLVLSMTTLVYGADSDYKLIIPEDATIVEIESDNFDEYFEDVKIISEVEENSRSIKNIFLFEEDNVLCESKAVWNIRGFLNTNYNNEFTIYGIFDSTNDLWLLSSRNMLEFISKNMGPCTQTNAIYDAENKILYYLSDDNVSRGYVLSYVENNGEMTVTKFDMISFGMSSTYKITNMTARFKKLPYVTVAYNDELIDFDQKPVIENGRTLVPLRAIFEKIGANVEWNGDTNTVIATKDGTSISLTIDNKTALKNGEEIILDVPAKIVNGRTLVPVRFIADCFGVDIQWNSDIKRVVLTK